MKTTLKRLWKNEYFQTAVVVILIVTVVFGFWYGSQAVLHTDIPPALAVVSGSMCIPYDGACDGWLSLNHPFARTLHKGDIIIIQGVDPADLNVDYPNSDIIVFHQPGNPDELIVHRVVSVHEVNGELYFITKGDGNGNPWPQTPQSGLDPWDYSSPAGVPQDMVVGKVIMRIPWIGWVAIFMHDVLGVNNALIGIPIIIFLIIVLVIVEFVIPILKSRGAQANQQTEPNAQVQMYL